MKPKSKPESLSSIEKALKILKAFAPHNQEMGTLELSQVLGMHKSTVSRLLHILTEQEFLQQNPETKKYLLGRSAAHIGDAVIKSLATSIVSIAMPHLNALRNALDESVALEQLSGTNVILATHVEGRRHIRFSFNSGEQVPMNVAAGAKAILAYCTPEFVDRCLNKKFVRFNDRTIVTRKEYRELLKEVRKTGIAYDKGERYEDTFAIATPIFNHEGVPVAAVVVAGPAFRMTPEFLNATIAPLKNTAAQISQRLFY
jgi:DNA-binding IclR family transcriptional regulator